MADRFGLGPPTGPPPQRGGAIWGGRAPSRHERVEDRPLGHPKAGHHRKAEGRERPRLLPAASAPGHLAAEAPFGFARDLHPLIARLLAETVDSGHARRGAGFRSSSAGQLHVWKVADHEDLLAIRADLGRAGEPGFGQAGGEPGADVLTHRLLIDYIITPRPPHPQGSAAR